MYKKLNLPHFFLPLVYSRLSCFRPIRRDQLRHKRIRSTRARLRAVDIRSPPRSSCPPHCSAPHIIILFHVVQATGDGLLAQAVDASTELADQADLVVRAEPAGGGLEGVGECGGVVAGGGGAAEVGVEVLMHLVDDLVLWVGEVAHGGAVVARAVVQGPRPCTGVCVAFGRDVLCRGSPCADTVDGGLVEADDEGLVHVVVFVVGVEDDLRVVGVDFRDGLPPRLEAAGIGDDGAVEAAVVVGGNHGIGAAGGDVVDGFGEVIAVARVDRPSETGWSKTLHQEVDTKDVRALADPGVKGREIVPGVVGAVDARNGCTKLRARFIDTKEFKSPG